MEGARGSISLSREGLCWDMLVLVLLLLLLLLLLLALLLLPACFHKACLLACSPMMLAVIHT